MAVRSKSKSKSAANAPPLLAQFGDAPKKSAERPVFKIIRGIHLYHDQYYRITIYQNGDIRIERPWCIIDPHQEMPTLEETDWALHKHLLNLINPTVYAVANPQHEYGPAINPRYASQQ